MTRPRKYNAGTSWDDIANLLESWYAHHGLFVEIAIGGGHASTIPGFRVTVKLFEAESYLRENPPPIIVFRGMMLKTGDSQASQVMLALMQAKADYDSDAWRWTRYDRMRVREEDTSPQA